MTDWYEEKKFRLVDPVSGVAVDDNLYSVRDVFEMAKDLSCSGLEFRVVSKAVLSGKAVCRVGGCVG